MNIYAQGYLDNVRITAPGTVTAAPTPAAVTPDITAAGVSATPTKKATPKTTLPTPYPSSTPESPSSLVVPLAALGIIGGCFILLQKKE
jgi:hypothetical protein